MNIDILREYLVLDLTSSTYLRWVKTSSNRGKAGNEAFTAVAHGYSTGKLLGVKLMAHRVIYALKVGKWPDGDVDHIDGNCRNNHPDNLREVTKSVNQHNQRRAKGFTWNVKANKFYVKLKVLGATYWVGAYDTALDARAAYLKAKMKVHPDCGWW